MSTSSKKYLVVSDYWIGDTIKTQTVCQILKEEDPNCTIDFLTKWPQLLLLLKQNPYIDNVKVARNPTSRLIPISEEIASQYDAVLRNSGEEWDVTQTPGELYQRNCGIQNPRKSFDVYTDPGYDDIAQSQINGIRSKNPHKLIIGVDVGWRGKSALTSQIESLDILKILSPLSNKYCFLPLGLVPPGVNQPPPQITSAKGDVKKCIFQFSLTASAIKYCDAILASESGILNTAVGIKTTPIIYAKDFLYALAGPNGKFGSSNTPEKFMGPEAYDGVKYVDTLHQDLTDKTYLDAIASKLASLEAYYNLQIR